MIDKLLTRFRSIARDMGWSDGLLYLAARIIQRLTSGRVELRKYYFVSQPVPQRALLPANRGNSIVVQPAALDHPLTDRFPRPAKVIAARFAGGARCFLAAKDDRFVGFLWMQTGVYLEDEVRCRFIPLPADRTAWDFDVHVEPEYRASFAFARLWDTANQFLRETGVEWSVSRISAFNPGSINSHTRLGAFPIGSACFLNGRTWQLMLSTLAPYIHLSPGEHHIPAIRLPATPSHRKGYRRFATAPSGKPSAPNV